jgi:hypothetical protein
MNLHLKRVEYRSDGIFGDLLDESGNLVAHTLEHAYPALGPYASWTAKVAVGTYECVRHAPHRLRYETFLLKDVPDFRGKPVEGILIHCGNFGKDSEGCILLGESVTELAGLKMVARSKDAFARFMAFQHGCNEFQLIIS